MSKDYSVNDIAKLCNISKRTIHYYDEIGLLKPVRINEENYRFYDDSSLRRIKLILLFKELDFPLKEIVTILDNREENYQTAIAKQIELLILKRDRLNNIIQAAKKIQEKGEMKMSFKEFDNKKYEERVKELYGKTAQYKEYQQKNINDKDANAMGNQLLDLFSEVNKVMELGINNEVVISKVKAIQSFISNNYYQCDDEMFLCLADVYEAGDMKTNIDAHSGEGTAQFVADVIRKMLQK